ncbi:MAG: hypothetical protein AB8F74_03735 [Saprospiraceae bacterium]
MRFYLFLLCFLLSFMSSRLMQKEDNRIKKITVYKTFEEYKSEKGAVHTGEFKYGSLITRPGINNFHINFPNRKKGAKERQLRVVPRKIWGFKLDDYLFRIDKTNSNPYFVRSQGKICYYENGAAIINVLRRNGTIDSEIRYALEEGWGQGTSYVSESINSKLRAFGNKNAVKRYIKKHPELQEVYDCTYPAKWKEALQKKRDCIEAYNAK